MLSEERLTILVEKLRSGDISQEGKEELICGHLLLGMKLVRKIAYQYEIDDRSDLEGEMALAITKAIADGQKKLVTNDIGKYITKTVIYKLKTYIKKFSAASKSERTIRHKLAKGINKFNILLPEVKALPEDKIELMKKLNPQNQYQILEQARVLSTSELRDVVQNAIYESLQVPKRQSVVSDRSETGGYIPTSRETVRLELLEAIKLTAQSPMEHAILRMRSEGYSYEEIGKEVGFHFVVIGEKVRKMEERFDEIWR